MPIAPKLWPALFLVSACGGGDGTGGSDGTTGAATDSDGTGTATGTGTTGATATDSGSGGTAGTSGSATDGSSTSTGTSGGTGGGGTVPIGDPCTDDAECVSGACKDVLGGTGSVCAPGSSFCVLDDGGGLEYSESTTLCPDPHSFARCDNGEWDAGPCDLGVPQCLGGECYFCPPGEYFCVDGRDVGLCDAQGLDYQWVEFCDGTNICQAGAATCQPSCTPGAGLGCLPNGELMVCPPDGLPPQVSQPCPDGTLCVEPGFCVESPFPLLAESASVGDLALIDTSPPRAALTYNEAYQGDVHLLSWELDTNTPGTNVTLGSGSSPRVDAVLDSDISNVVTAREYEAVLPMEDRVELRVFNSNLTDAADGGGNFPAQAPDVVALGAGRGLVVHRTDENPAEIQGRILNVWTPIVTFVEEACTATSCRGEGTRVGTDRLVIARRDSSRGAGIACRTLAGDPVTPMTDIPGAPTSGVYWVVVDGVVGGPAVMAWWQNNEGPRAVRIDPDCTVNGPIIEVDSVPSGQPHVEFAVWPDGSFVVVYLHPASNDRYRTMARFFDALGNPTGEVEVLPPGFGPIRVQVEAWGTDRYAVAAPLGVKLYGIVLTRP